MKLINVFLILVISCRWTNAEPAFDWKNLLPWTKDMPKEDYMENIKLHLVKKDWKPNGANLPDVDEITPRFSGTAKQAFEMFIDEKNMYAYHAKPLKNAVDILKPEFGYNPSQESIFVIHTISGDAHNYYVKNMMIALALRNFLKHYNVFAFNMPRLQGSMERSIVKSIYGQKANYKSLGETIGTFFNSAIQQKLMNPNQIHFLGFCYSSQLAGYIARDIASKNNNQKIKSISALDPFSTGLTSLRNRVLSKNDAQVVHAYHTSSLAYGTLYRRATADFILNSGITQPGCNFVRSYMCSHRRAVTAFWYVVLYPDLWLARRCSSWLKFKACLCNTKETAPITFPPTLSPRGKYYLNTMPQKPYGYGPQGANCYVRNKVEKKPGTQLGNNKGRGKN